MVKDLKENGLDCFKIISQNFQIRNEQTTRNFRQKFLHDLLLRDKMSFVSPCVKRGGAPSIIIIIIISSVYLW
jgi:hypothetical protein